jgi:ribonuclease HI
LERCLKHASAIRTIDTNGGQWTCVLRAVAPSWGGRVQVISKQKEWDYDLITNTLVTICRENSTINIFCDGVISNKGRADGKQVGATSAALYQEGRERKHTERIIGQSVTESDAILRSLHSGLDTLTTFLDDEPVHRSKLIIFTLASGTAINKALDSSPHENQEESLKILRRLSNLVDTFPNINITLMWLPRKAPFIGFRRAKQLALEAARTADLTNLAEPQSINSQMKSTKDSAVRALTERWHQSPHTSMAYRTALNAPPDGKTHHTFPPKHQAAPEPGQTTTVKFSRLTHSTFYRMVTGHAFVGEYTQRFYPQHTPDQIACQCGEPLQTIEHVLMHCPNYTAARHKLLTDRGRPRNFPQLFENPKRVQELLRFLEETGACSKPRATWEPG